LCSHNSKQAASIIEESKLRALIQKFGNQGALPVREIPEKFQQLFHCELNLSVTRLFAAIKNADYKDIELKKAEFGGPLVVILTKQGSEPKGKMRKTKYASATPDGARAVGNQKSKSSSASPQVKRSTGIKRKSMTMDDPVPTDQSTMLPSNAPSAPHVSLDSNTVNPPSALLHSKTTGLSCLDMELENRKLQLQEESNAMALFQMKVPDNDETGKQILELMKQKTLKRLQQEVEMEPKREDVAWEQYPEHSSSHSYTRSSHMGGARSLYQEETNFHTNGATSMKAPARMSTSVYAESEHATDERQLYDYPVSRSSLRLPSLYTNMLIERLGCTVRKWVKEESKLGIQILSKFSFAKFVTLQRN
jgi:hypothetical protein